MAGKWTKEEDELLIRSINNGLRNKDLYELFPNRGKPAINTRAAKIRTGKPLEYIEGEIIGQHIGKLVVDKWVGTELDEKYNIVHNLYECTCYCDETHTNKTVVREGNLRSYNTTSCGCNKSMTTDSNPNRNHNEYEVWNNIVFVKFSNCNEYFLCDLDDWERFGKYHSWYKDAMGYAVSRVNYKLECMHELIMNAPKGMDVDHNYRVSNGICDNRKSNLIIKTHSQNAFNVGLRSHNTSGYMGVGKDDRDKKWFAEIIVDKKRYCLGRYEHKNDAVRARLQAEHDLLGVLAPQRHLFKEFGIDDSDLQYDENSFVNPEHKLIKII